MPLDGADYSKPTIKTVRDGVLNEFEAEFGDIDRQQGSVWYTLADGFATSIVENQEESLDSIFDSAFLDTASGDNLDNVVDIIGIDRIPAAASTGYVRFDAGSFVTSDTTISSGTAVTTGGDGSVSFDTANEETLALLDDFEDNDINEYNEDTGDFSTQTSTVINGTYTLKGNASGSQIVSSTGSVKRGDVLRAKVQVTAGGKAGFLFITSDSDNTYRALLDEASGSFELEKIDDGSVTDLDTVSRTVSTGTTRRIYVYPEAQGTINVELRDTSGNTLETLSADDSTFNAGSFGFHADGSSDVFFDQIANKVVSAEIEAVETGGTGNVGANSIDSLVSSISGVDSVNNPKPTGDTGFLLPDGTTQTSGTDEESDEELRDRVERITSQGGAGTADAILAELLAVESVRSATLVVNHTDTDGNISSPSGFSGTGPSAHHFEAIVLDGDSSDIAQAIYDTKSVTDGIEAGNNGTKKTETIDSDVNGQSFDIVFTRPTEKNINLTLDLTVTDGEYIGDNPVRNDVVDYIGGTDSDGNSVPGLDAGDDVVLDKITDAVVGEDNGIIGVQGDPTIDSHSTTTTNGLTVVDVTASEVAQTDATDGSITINTTKV